MTSFSEETELGYLFGVIRRRIWQMVLPAVAVFVVVAVVVALLPAKYESSATILIEGQEVPQELVRSTVTGFVEERLQTITQVVLNRANLMSIIDRVGLYQDQRKSMTSEALVEMMRKDITMEPIQAEVMSNTGRPATATIAFSVAFEGTEPAKVLQTTNTLVSLFLEENLKNREEKASTAYSFLEKQLVALRDEVAQSEELIARFKEEHLGSLPELTQLNLQTLERIERDAQAVQENIRGILERRAFLEGQLATVTPQRTLVTAEGGRVLPPAEELRALKTRYVSLTATHSDKHPEVIKLREQIAALEGSGVSVDLAEELAAARANLADLNAKYGLKHPDVQAAERRVAALEKSGAGRSRMVASSVADSADNPAWMALKSQLQATDMDLRSQQVMLADLRLRQDELTRRLENTPRVEQEYRKLERDHQNAQLKFQETSQKLMAARDSKELEEERAGEKLTLIEPPMLPEVPSKPKRMLLMLVGFVMSLGFGAGCGALAEAMDGSVRGLRSLHALTKVPLLGSIPYVATGAEVARRKRKITMAVTGMAGALAVLVLLIHVYVRPLDIIFYQILDRF
ncbi:Wzz/FepE/Etk N-terminal domain-containing protein [Desulfomicrobium baculatum]|uniref:Lipopolysaccharide biosynthesis protein n=1 Tax=Desulfomicrobium baculatum (strain DSM 4028 / VKM B-1378 / X) TaxID=525897 RepID=C7LSB3_DESBD|nr:Wzz/FepE/Etk N-terminal domain-containing protein [Desulfomicrobium baculatum]ACU90661.1 lipopolysaccharide biosynthesis protein [Desulfomicrobium baculatum DSM 4028]